MVTPSGRLKKYNPATSSEYIIATDIPSDPSDPARAKTIDPPTLPKNEPIYGLWEFLKHNILNPIGKGAKAIKGKEETSSQQTPSNSSTSNVSNPATSGTTQKNDLEKNNK